MKKVKRGKKMKKILGVLLMLVVLGGAAVGCGSSGKGPGDVTMLYVDAFVSGNVDGIISYDSAIAGMLSEASGGSSNIFEEAFIQGIEQSGLFLTDEQKQGLIDGYKKTMSVAEIKVVDEKEDGDSAVVTLEVKGIAVGAAVTEATKTLQADINSGVIPETTTQDEIDQMSIDNIIKVLKNPVVATESEELEINLTKEKGKWVISEDQLLTLFSSIFIYE